MTIKELKELIVITKDIKYIIIHSISNNNFIRKYNTYIKFFKDIEINNYKVDKFGYGVKISKDFVHIWIE